MTEKERFVDNGDGTVTDRKTGLMWVRTDTMNDLKKWVNYQEAVDYVWELKAGKFAGYDDWRLPGRDEMLALYDEAFSNKDTFGKEIHISSRFAPGGGLSMMAQIIRGRPRTFVLSLRDGEISAPDGLWTLSESARAVRTPAAHDRQNMP